MKIKIELSKDKLRCKDTVIKRNKMIPPKKGKGSVNKRDKVLLDD